jgi:hydrogenase large subunit
MSWDPITRIVGNLGIYTKIDFDNREVVECKSTSSVFRGYSVFMKGKDPRDAHFITSRICGICGDNHAVCSVYAQNMAYGIAMPPLAEWIYNLGEAAEYIFDHRADGRAQRRDPRLPHHRRHHARLQPLHGRALQRGP